MDQAPVAPPGQPAVRFQWRIPEPSDVPGAYVVAAGPLLQEALRICDDRHRHIETATLNTVVQQAVASHPRPHSRNKQLKVYYATQAEVNPPTFVFFTNDAKLVHFSYRRYLENTLRKSFGFDGTPLRMVFKTRGEE